MKWIQKYSTSVSVTIFLISLMLTVTGAGLAYALTDSINTADRAFSPKFLELKDGDMKGFSNDGLRILAVAGFGEAKRLSEAYKKRGADSQKYIEFLAWIMLAQLLCLGAMFIVLYQSKKLVAVNDTV